MYTYSTNMMGPMTHWFESNNIPYRVTKTYSKLFDKEIEYKTYEPWYGGRIDIYGDYSGFGYPDECGLPIMSGESYSRFSRWLEKYSSEELKTFDELRLLFESEEDFKLIIFDEMEINE